MHYEETNFDDASGHRDGCNAAAHRGLCYRQYLRRPHPRYLRCDPCKRGRPPPFGRTPARKAAVTVQMIYSLYLQGCGQKEVARKLNDMGRKTPAQRRAENCGREVKATHNTSDGQFVWTYASVKNVLVEEAYTGILNNHRREYTNGKVQEYAEAMRKQCTEELKKVAKMQKMCALRKPVLDAHIVSLQKDIQRLEGEIDEMVMDKIISPELPGLRVFPKMINKLDHCR